jgi:hypothetical protein
VQVQYCGLKPDDFEVRVLRNEFPDAAPELDELEFPAQRLEVNCVFHPDFWRRPLDCRRKQPEMLFQSARADPVGLLQQVLILDKQFARRRDGSSRDLERLGRN